jgi:hypothetical protein
LLSHSVNHDTIVPAFVLRLKIVLINSFAEVSELVTSCTMLSAVAQGCFGSLACRSIPALVSVLYNAAGVQARQMAVDTRHRTEDEAHEYLDRQAARRAA